MKFVFTGNTLRLSNSISFRAYKLSSFLLPKHSSCHKCLRSWRKEKRERSSTKRTLCLYVHLTFFLVALPRFYCYVVLSCFAIFNRKRKSEKRRREATLKEIVLKSTPFHVFPDRYFL